MLGIALTSETFERLLFKVETEPTTYRYVASTVLVSLNPQKLKKSNIVIISNGVEQNRCKQKRKRYVA